MDARKKHYNHTIGLNLELVATTPECYDTIAKYFKFTPAQAMMYFGILHTAQACWPSSLIERLKSEPSICYDLATEIIAQWCKDEAHGKTVYMMWVKYPGDFKPHMEVYSTVELAKDVAEEYGVPLSAWKSHPDGYPGLIAHYCEGEWNIKFSTII